MVKMRGIPFKATEMEISEWFNDYATCQVAIRLAPDTGILILHLILHLTPLPAICHLPPDPATCHLTPPPARISTSSTGLTGGRAAMPR